MELVPVQVLKALTLRRVLRVTIASGSQILPEETPVPASCLSAMKQNNDDDDEGTIAVRKDVSCLNNGA